MIENTPKYKALRVILPIFYKVALFLLCPIPQFICNKFEFLSGWFYIKRWNKIPKMEQKFFAFLGLEEELNYENERIRELLFYPYR